jgi:serine/threonine protein kinase
LLFFLLCSYLCTLPDFGLAKHCDSVATRGIGTPDYMSPEMVSPPPADASSAPGAARYDPRAVDAWALGVTLYLLVTGKYPFEDPAKPGSVAHTLRRIREGLMRPLPMDVSPECASLIYGLLTSDPAGRLTIEEAMRHRWIARHCPHVIATWDSAAGDAAAGPLAAMALSSGTPPRSGGAAPIHHMHHHQAPPLVPPPPPPTLHFVPPHAQQQQGSGAYLVPVLANPAAGPTSPPAR